MKSWIAIVGVLAGAVALVALFMAFRGVPAPNAARLGEPSLPGEVHPTELQHIIIPGSKPSAPIDYAQALRKSRNYLDFVQLIFPAAKSGDKEAQYRLGKALAFCDEMFPIYYQRKGEPLTLDEGLAYAATLHRSNELAQTIYDRCHDLKGRDSQEFGKAEDWIAMAASAGQPAAQASIVILNYAHQIVGPRDSDANPSLPPLSNKYDDLRGVLQGAVQSKDPEVIWKIGAVQGYMNQSHEDKVENQLAWWLVSCQRGYDCSPNADWVKLQCTDESYCVTGISGIDYIRNGAGANWPVVQRRADELNARLDAGQWNDLGLSPSVTE